MLYTFGNFELDTKLYVLRRHDQTVQLRPKVFHLLSYLLEHRDRVVSKQELSEHVWPEQFISNAAMESAIRLLRQALGDSGREQRLVQTVFGHGYRFLAPVTEQVAADPEPDPDLPAAVLEMPPLAGGWRCPTCQYVNATSTVAANKFCIECGTPFQSLCPACGEENPPQAKFCANCGRSISRGFSSDHARAPGRPHEAAPQAAPAGDWYKIPAAERRQLTLMVCDLVDAVKLPRCLDLEALHDVIRAYQAMCTDVIQRFDGHIAQHRGTALFIYFGYPQAHEDDAQRAIHAGLEMIEALGALHSRLTQEQGLTLAICLGIHTGPVIVDRMGNSGDQEKLVLGEPPQIAHQLQRLAPANTVVISAATARLVEGYFVCQDLGVHTVEGVSDPIRLSRVLGTSGVQNRLEITEREGLTPFVGRDAELILLQQRWSQVQDYLGQVIFISGEAGIGKSRLLRACTSQLPQGAYTYPLWHCSPYHQQSALYPIIDFLQKMIQWQPSDTPAAKRQKLEAHLKQYNLPLVDLVPFFASLLSIQTPEDREAFGHLTPQQQRQKTLEAIVSVIMTLADRQPVWLVVEDLHWADPSTIDLLTLLIDQTPTTRLGLLLTFRPTFQPPWGNRSYLTHITLSRLPRHQTEQIVSAVTRGKSLPPALLQQIIDKTDGVPLFIEECTKTLLESGLLQETEAEYELTVPLFTLTIPTTLQDSLMARLDRLGTAKRVAQLGATIGRRVPYDLLCGVWQHDEMTLKHELERLVDAELMYQKGLPPQATYIFKHALIQETAYQSLLKNTRQQYHRQIAHVLMEKFAEITALQPELLAYHYTEAGLSEQALPYWQQAGQRAVERSANHEAVSHFTKGLEVLHGLPESPERVQHELALHMALGAPLWTLKGHAAPEVEQVYNRTLKLCQQVGDTPQRFSVLVGLWRFYLARARLQKAHELAEQCALLAPHLRDPVFLLEAHLMLGSTLFYLGELASGHEHLEQGMALYNPRQGNTRAFSRATDPRVDCLCRSSWVLCLLGYPDQALTRSREALALAEKLSHAHSLAFASFYASVLHQFRREPQAVLEQAAVTITLSQEGGFGQWLVGGMISRDWARAESKPTEENIAQLCRSLAAWHATGVELGNSRLFAMLAEVYAKAGQAEAGLGGLTEALALVHKNEEHYYDAELHRLRGELLLLRAIPDEWEAENSFQLALGIARRQRAKLLELRAAVRLSRLWQQQGKREKARQVLTEIYGWFTEGFKTPDLQEARALLDALR